MRIYRKTWLSFLNWFQCRWAWRLRSPRGCCEVRWRRRFRNQHQGLQFEPIHMSKGLKIISMYDLQNTEIGKEILGSFFMFLCQKVNQKTLFSSVGANHESKTSWFCVSLPISARHCIVFRGKMMDIPERTLYSKRPATFADFVFHIKSN